MNARCHSLEQERFQPEKNFHEARLLAANELREEGRPAAKTHFRKDPEASGIIFFFLVSYNRPSAKTV